LRELARVGQLDINYKPEHEGGRKIWQIVTNEAILGLGSSKESSGKGSVGVTAEDPWTKR